LADQAGGGQGRLIVKAFLKRIGQGLAGLGLLTGCATAQAPVAAQAVKPALWKVSDADTTIYLFGTIHLLPEGLEWRTPALERAIAGSDSLVMEAVLGDDPMAQAQAMMKLGMRQGLPPLRERVPADKQAALDAMIKATGVPAAALDRMETWAAGLTLLAVSFQRMGLKADAGVESKLAAAYKGKRVSGLETVEQQLGYFDTLSEESQRAFLVGVLDDPAGAQAEFRAMLDAWVRGDVARIAETFDSETTMTPELREVLMTRRNQAWAEWIDGRLDQPGTVLVAVGAGHLAGRDSVQAMLAAKGLKAERVQ
jgi:uncharacterized protein